MEVDANVILTMILSISLSFFFLFSQQEKVSSSAHEITMVGIMDRSKSPPADLMMSDESESDEDRGTSVVESMEEEIAIEEESSQHIRETSGNSIKIKSLVRRVEKTFACSEGTSQRSKEDSDELKETESQIKTFPVTIRPTSSKEQSEILVKGILNGPRSFKSISGSFGPEGIVSNDGGEEEPEMSKLSFYLPEKFVEDKRLLESSLQKSLNELDGISSPRPLSPFELDDEYPIVHRHAEENQDHESDYMILNKLSF